MTKRLGADPLFFLAPVAILGILIADALPGVVPYWGAFLMLACASWAWRRRPLGTTLFWAAVAVAYAAVHASQWHSLRAFPQHHRLAEKPEGFSISAVGRVVDEPRMVGASATQAEVGLQELTIGERTYHLPHHLLLRASGHELNYGDVLRFTGRLYLPEAPRNPGQFDYRSYLHRHHWVGIVEVGPVDELTLLQQRPHPFKAVAMRARSRMAQAITRDLEEEPEICAVLTAMVLGMREQATPEMKTPFRHCGTLHIFAVSGLHVGIFALIAWLLMKPLGLSRAQVTWILIPLLFFYAFVTGWRPSAVRAATMAAVFLAAFCIHRQPRLLNGVGLAALVILASDTNQLFLPGFQLSFIVLLSIITLTRPLQRPFRRWLYPDPLIPPSLVQDYERRSYAWRRWAGNTVSVSAAAWLGSLPPMMLTFHLVTPVAVLANCIFMPLAFVILLTAAVSMLCSVVGILGWANILFCNANFALVHVLMSLAEAFSGLPGSHFHVSNRLPFTRPPLEITVLDLPMGGACTHVEMRGQTSELIDVGHRKSFSFFTLPYLHSAGLNQLDRLWLSHGDTSHVSAGPTLLSLYQPKVYTPAWPTRSPSVGRLEALLVKQNRPAVPLHAGQSLPLAQDAHWDVLYPPEAESFAPARADDRGLVLHLHAYHWKVLFMADAGFHTERWLLDSGRDLRAHVLIKGNHADDVSGLAEFLTDVQPQVVILDTETDQALEAKAWAKTNARHLIDQAEVGAVILGISQSEIRVRGFLHDEEFFLKRAR